MFVHKQLIDSDTYFGLIFSCDRETAAKNILVYLLFMLRCVHSW